MAAKTREELASEYGVCVKTLNKWFKENGISVNRGLISPAKQKEIYKYLGNPAGSKK